MPRKSFYDTRADHDEDDEFDDRPSKSQRKRD